MLRGTGTTGLTDTVDLLAQQRLLGEAVNLVVGGTTLFTGTPANRPPLSGTVNVDDANTISGVAIAGSGAPAIAGATGDVAGTIADVTLSGAAGGLNLNATTGTWDLSRPHRQHHRRDRGQPHQRRHRQLHPGRRPSR